ncbi:hypothetical protein [Gephyromycinifex aptenodytis]|uniref:hypothetical protein n=1 Tax=Gephyromycinifex aptenodytis TaxID=2716227 RepID=UPI0014461110|nr:hypothetical protein [Gephyromycinifex aptenodytis]
MARLVGVYNARGGLAGELRYLLGKVTGGSHCALCDITHGLNPRGKKQWRALSPRLPLAMSVVHLDEMDAAAAALVGPRNAPAVLYLDGRNDRILLDAAALERCNGDPVRLAAAISSALAASD